MKYFLLLMLIVLQQFAIPWCDAQRCNFTTLAKSLIEDDENMYQLSLTFFPPVDNSPEFVKVNYIFTETGETQAWYWSVSSSSFIHPPEVLQFMSLFFTKAHNFFSGEVQLMLSSDNGISISDCAQDLEKMQLLTQRLQLYAMRQMRTVIIDTSYTAKAFIASIHVNDTKFNKVTFEAASPIKITALVIASLVVIIVWSIFIIFAIICLFGMSKPDHWLEKMDKKKPLICSIALVSVAFTLYNCILSSLAKHRFCTQYTTHPLYVSNLDRTTHPVNLLLAVDSICLIASILTIIIIACLACCVEWCRSFWYVFLSLPILAPIFSVVAHSPYIIIGYLNDGHHANSIFIYYTVVIGIGYAICWVGFHPHTCVQPTSTREEPQSQCKDITINIIAFIVVVLFYLGIVITITVYFVAIPINKSVSDAPDRLAGIYQSGGFIIVSFVLYKMIAFFYKANKKTGIEKAITKWESALDTRENSEDWKKKPNDDKIDELYDAMLRIIVEHYRRTTTGQPNAASD